MCHFSSQYWQQNWYLGQPISRAAVMLWDNWQLLTLNHSSSAAVAQRWQPRGVRCQQHKLELDFLFKQTYLLDWMPTWIYVHLFLVFFKSLCDFSAAWSFFGTVCQFWLNHIILWETLKLWTVCVQCPGAAQSDGPRSWIIIRLTAHGSMCTCMNCVHERVIILNIKVTDVWGFVFPVCVLVDCAAERCPQSGTPSPSQASSHTLSSAKSKGSLRRQSKSVVQSHFFFCYLYKYIVCSSYSGCLAQMTAPIILKK